MASVVTLPRHDKGGLRRLAMTKSDCFAALAMTAKGAARDKKGEKHSTKNKTRFTKYETQTTLCVSRISDFCPAAQYLNFINKTSAGAAFQIFLDTLVILM